MERLAADMGLKKSPDAPAPESVAVPAASRPEPEAAGAADVPEVSAKASARPRRPRIKKVL